MSSLPIKSIYLVRNGPPEKAFEFREGEISSISGSEVVIKVEASGINFADILARLGLYPDAPKLPCVLGYEVVGRVERVGAEVQNVSVGDRVLVFTRFGGYASRVIAESEAVVKIPDDMDPGTGAALGAQFCTAWFAAEEMVRLKKGDRVLIHAAAGGVGMALTQIAKRRGCVVFGTAGSEEKLNLIRENGVDHPVNYRTDDFSQKVQTVLGKEGLDVVFDSLGGRTYRKSYRLLGAGGRIVTLGVAESTGRGWSLFRLLKTALNFGIMSPVLLLENSKGIIGVNMLRIADKNPRALQQCLKAVVDLATKKELRPIVGKVFPAERVAEAHEYVESRKSFGKVILKWD